MNKSLIPLILVAALVLTYSSCFRVFEGQLALITQFGRIIDKPIDQAGIHFKVPLLQDVRYFEKRILEWDGEPNQIPTKDKKFIWVDTTARWRIVDAVKFAEKVVSESGAQSRLDSILDGATRDVISKNNLVEAVRNSNTILTRLKELRTQIKKQQENQADFTTTIMEEEVTGNVEEVSSGRENLSQMILESAKEKLSDLGIKIIDVQIRRIAYEKSVEQKVYERMISERNRIAEKIRSVGKGEQAKIRGKLNRKLKEIESKAYRTSQEIRGKAEAEAVGIYAGAYQKSPQFYELVRTLEAYQKAFPQKGKFILSTDSEFLKLLKSK